MTLVASAAPPPALPAFRDRAVRFGGDGALAGIITQAVRPRIDAPMFVFLSAGIVHRVGPNRMHVMLSRALASDGFSSARFDFSGIGDSTPRVDGTPAEEAAILETVLVMDALQQSTGTRRFVLAGLCSGAVAAFHAAVRDGRVAGLVLLNPQGFDHDAAWNTHVQTLTQARRYVTTAAASASNWKRALTGRIDYRRAARVLARRLVGAATVGAGRHPVAERLHAGFQELGRRSVRTLVICSEGDSSIDYMSQILGRDVAKGCETAALEVRVAAQTDHSFTLLAAQQQLLAAIRGWLAGPAGRTR